MSADGGGNYQPPRHVVRIIRPPSEGDIVKFSTGSQQSQQRPSQIVFINSSSNNNTNGNLRGSTVSYSSQHQQLVRQNLTYKCKTCQWTGDSDDRFMEHLCSVHLEPPNKEGSKNNNKRQATSRNSASTNTTTITPVGKTTSSDKGKPSTKSKPSNEGTSSRGQTESTDPASYRYACQFVKCSRRFMKLDQLRQHHRGHLNLKPFHCSWEGCGQVFSRRPTGLRHVRSIHFKMSKEKIINLSSEEKAQAYEYITTVNEMVAEEESALDAVRLSKQRIPTSNTNTSATITSSSTLPKTSKRPSPDVIDLDDEDMSDEEENSEDQEDSGDDDDDNYIDQQQLSNQESPPSEGRKRRPERYVCQFPLCGKEYKKLFSLRMHHRSHTKTQPYYCKFPVVSKDEEDEDVVEERECGELFRRKSNAFRHIHARHFGIPKKNQINLPASQKAKAAPYIGEKKAILDKEEARLESLRVHKLREPGAPPLKYQCQWPDCGKYFVAPGKLHMHVRRHSERRPYYCKWPDCTRLATIEKTQMLKHILVEHLNLKKENVIISPVRVRKSRKDGNESSENSRAIRKTVSKAYSEEEKEKALPYLGIHQNLIDEEKKIILRRTEVVEPVVVKEEDVPKTTSDFNFQALFSVPVTSPFPPINFAPVFGVQIAVHKF